MIVRICPMCDSEMKKTHYCDVCHSWIWKPQMLDVHFNSQTRGMGEPDCAYGDEHDAYHHMMGSDNKYYQNDQKEANGKHRAKKTQARAERVQRQTNAGNKTDKKSVPGIIIFVIVLLYILISFVAGELFEYF